MPIFKEFKLFISRGNVVDLAVGVIIGSTFGKIVSSLVNDIIMPPIGILVGGVNFTNLKFTLKNTIDSTGQLAPVTINYGTFLQTAVDFVIIAFSIFLFVKLFNAIKRKEVEETKPSMLPTNEEKLLTEIRDILKNRDASPS